jgi:asparagine synthase (glutamine-hydrolysing)
MCGIWGFLGLYRQLGLNPADLVKTLLPRGPEYMETKELKNCFLGFTRLAINGLTPAGNQPMTSPSGKWIVVCNGEIFNYKEIASKFQIPSSYLGSDCFVIPWLLEYLSVRDVCRQLDGVFAFLAYNTETDELHIGRDTFGVRPLFYCKGPEGYAFGSEMKSLVPLQSQITFFPPSSYGTLKFGGDLVIERWTSLTWHKDPTLKEGSQCIQKIQELVVESVRKRLLSDRPVGALLSGGLDSSLVASLAAKMLRKEGKQIHTFSIGLGESPDILAARKVASFIGSIHHEIIMTPEEFLAAVEPVINAVETYDITSVRASVGNWLLGKWIKENTDIKVIMNGDGSDELFGGYLYFYRAPSPSAFENEIERLLDEIHLYDVARSERSMAAHGLESRTPFLDRQLVDAVRRMPTEFFMPSTERAEKWILRSAFMDQGLLPDEILWRRKEAFSDGVSSRENSWFEILKKVAKEKVARRGVHYTLALEYEHNPPLTDEARWYRDTFESFFGSQAALVIPHMWMPKWSPETTDPSARTLSHYATAT